MSIAKIVITSIILIFAIIFFALTGHWYMPMSHDGNLSDIGIYESKNVSVRYMTLTDGVLHYKFQATAKEIDSIVKTLKLSKQEKDIPRTVRDPYFFYPISDKWILYYSKATDTTHVQKFLYFYPEKEKAYYVYYDP
jgi:hypothetical protein